MEWPHIKASCGSSRSSASAWSFSLTFLPPRPGKQPSGGGTYAGHMPRCGVRLSIRRLRGLQQLLYGSVRSGSCPNRTSPSVCCRRAESRRKRYPRTAWHSFMLPPSRHDHFGWLATDDRPEGPLTGSPLRQCPYPCRRPTARTSATLGPPFEQVTSLRLGTGVEPATARFSVWCSTTELTCW